MSINPDYVYNEKTRAHELTPEAAARIAKEEAEVRKMIEEANQRQLSLEAEKAEEIRAEIENFAKEFKIDYAHLKSLPRIKAVKTAEGFKLFCPFCGFLHTHRDSGRAYKCSTIKNRTNTKAYYIVMAYSPAELKELGITTEFITKKRINAEMEYAARKEIYRIAHGKY